MKLTLLSLCALLATPLPSLASTPSIGLYSSLDCTSCNLSIPLYQQGTFYIVFNTNGNPLFQQHGLALVEFAVEGVPAGWIQVVEPTITASVHLGDPLNGGAQMAWNFPPFGDCILLYTVTLFATSEISDLSLHVTQHSHPSNLNFQCPNAMPSIPPVFGNITCVGAGSLHINSQEDCQVSVRRTTWSDVRRLYE